MVMHWIKQHPGSCASIGGTIAVFCLMALRGGDSGLKTVRVSGVVTLDGSPIPNVQVSFEPKMNRGVDSSACPGSFGVTDADGRYELSWSGASGAMVGEHIVTLVDAQSGNNQAGEAPRGSPGKKKAVRLPDGSVQEVEQLEPDSSYRLPEKARDGSLRYLVPEGGTDTADFAFQSQ
jgi:hypothetical protein